MDLSGRKLGKYQVVESIALGGMAEVFKAFQPGIERQVVVKVLHCHLAGRPDAVARFQREARAIGSLHHPHIVHIIDIDTQDDLYYMVVDYIEGGTLAEYIAKREVLSVAEALQIGVQLAGALAYAHAQGVIHRDIKPANIMFADQACTRALLADFGLAHLCKESSDHLTMPGTMIGTPAYMSPEALRGEACDGRADIYGLGVVLYQLLTGTTPYVANTPYSMMAQQDKQPLPSPRVLNPALSVPVEDLLLKALAKEPDRRFQNATEFGEAMQQVLAGLRQKSAQELPAAAPVRPTPPPPVKPAAAHSPRWLHLVLAMGGVALTMLLTVALMFQL